MSENKIILGTNDSFMFIAVGIMFLLIGLGIGFAVQWSTADPILAGCEELSHRVYNDDDRRKVIYKCLEESTKRNQLKGIN